MELVSLSVRYCACEQNGSAGALCRAICNCGSRALRRGNRILVQRGIKLI